MKRHKAFTLTELVAAILVISVVLGITLKTTKNKMEKVDKYYYYMAYSIAKDISQNVISQNNFGFAEDETADSGLSKLAYNFNKFLLSKFKLKTQMCALDDDYDCSNIKCSSGFAKYDRNLLKCVCTEGDNYSTDDFTDSNGWQDEEELFKETEGGLVDSGIDNTLPNEPDPEPEPEPEPDPEPKPEPDPDPTPTPTPDPEPEEPEPDPDPDPTPTPTPATPEEPTEPVAEVNLSTASDLCNEIIKVYNVSNSNCSIPASTYSAAVTSGDFSGLTPHVVLNNGLRLFIASDFISVPKLATDDTSVNDKDKNGFILYIDSNGEKSGKNKVNADVFAFYLLKSGKMVPDGGMNHYNKLGGADSTDNLTVNVLYDDYSTGERKLRILKRNVDYKTGACASGNVISTTYCTLTNGTIVTKDAVCKPENDCRIQVNRPMRKLF